MLASSPSIISLLITFGGLLLGGLFIFMGWYFWYESRDLRNNGLTVTATVLKKFRREDQGLLGQLENYYARCAFQDGTGLPQEIDVYMPSKRWYQVSEGKTTQLTYVPDELDEAQPGSHFWWQLRGIIGIVLMAFGILAVAVFVINGFQEWFTAIQTV